MKYLIVLSGMMVLTFSIETHAALECSVSYKAKEVKVEKHWFGSVDKVTIHKGKIKGKGSDKNLCEKNALNKIKEIKNNNWKIIYKKTVIK